MFRNRNIVVVCLIGFVLGTLILKSIDSSSDVSEGDQAEKGAKYARLNTWLDDTTDHLIWIVQISDLHISIYNNPTILPDLEYFTNEVLSFIQPKVIIISGDLTDGKTQDEQGSRQNEQEWKSYEKFLKSNDRLKDAVWLDIRGNHDNFDVTDKSSQLNFFKKYGARKENERSYIHQLEMPNGDKYSFIAMDACVNPGPRRPFNFYGNLQNDDIEVLKRLNEQSINSTATLWFGHFPTSTIYSTHDLESVMSNGIAYLCGHLHTLFGLMRKMYARHSNGMLELELGDWKLSRMFRLMALDGGLLSFRDFKFSTNPIKNKMYVLITNPKDVQFKTTNNREPLHRSRTSSHVRFLVFSKFTVLSAKVYIDDVQLGEAKQVGSSPLFAIKWDPSAYAKRLHRLKIVLQDSNKNVEIVTRDFSLDDTVKSFGLFNNFILNFNIRIFTLLAFLGSFFGVTVILLFFRYNRRKYAINFIKCTGCRNFILKYLRRFAFLTSVDHVYWTLLIMTLYVPIGPWFVGRLLESDVGICFMWGLFVRGEYLEADVQYMFAFFHMMFFQFFLLLDLSNQIENRFGQLGLNPMTSTELPSRQSNGRKLIGQLLRLVYENVFFVLLVLSTFSYVKDLYLTYSIMAVLVCPIKTWALAVAVYLKCVCATLSRKDFEKFIDTSRLRNDDQRLAETIEADDASQSLLARTSSTHDDSQSTEFKSN